MKSMLPPAAGWMIACLLLNGCVEKPPESDVTSSAVIPSFERIEIPGVTTDHASTGGVSWVDYDDDGDLDLFVTNGYDVSAEAPTGQQNRLYRNDGEAGFVQVTAGPLATSEGFSSANTWGDFDNDGDLDVFITNQQDQDNQLFRNDGDGLFTPIEDEPPVNDGGHSYTATWIDVDSDGWLDLFVANGGMSHLDTNDLYRGVGGGHFEKITEGDPVTDEAATCGIAWGDYDNDGDPDLFVANQGFAPPASNDALYRNDGDWAFTRVDGTPVGNDGSPSCAATWVDVDNDLDLDLHVTKMYGLADLLYLNDGMGGMTPRTGLSLVLDGGHSYGANWEDYDNDGDIDVVVGNWGAGAVFHLNDGSGGFERARAGDLGGRVDFVGAMASADFDADGDIDVYVGNWPNNPGPGEPNVLYRNRGEGGNWLRVKLAGKRGGGPPFGARIFVTTRQGTETATQMRTTASQSGFRGQSDFSTHFGLGKASEVVSIEVRWPSGATSTHENVGINRVVLLVEPESSIG